MDKTELEKYEQMSEEEQEKRIRQAVPNAKAAAKAKGQPTCEFDQESGRVFFLYPDGPTKYPLSDEQGD